MKRRVETKRKPLGVVLSLAMVVGLMFAMCATAYADESANYKVQVASTEHGKVTAPSTSAAKGESVSLTATPDDGYVLKSLTATYREAFTEEIDATVSLDIPYPASEHFESESRSRAAAYGWVINTDPGFEFNSLQIYCKGAYSKQGYTITSIELTDSKANGKPSLDRLTPSPWSVAVATDDGKVIYDYSNSNTSHFELVNGKYESRTFSKATIHALTGTQQRSIEVSGNSGTFTMPAGDVTISAVFAQQAAASKAPAAVSGLTYNSKAQELVTAGTATGGTMQYALGNEGGATEAYSTSIPKATGAGAYHVWYKVVGDESHVDTAPASVPVTIGKADPTAEAPTGLTATYGQTLADVALANPQGNTPGTWAWADSAQSVGAAGERTHSSNFTPTDTTNYNNKTNVSVNVTVLKQVVTPPTIVEKPYINDSTTQTADVPESSLYSVTENDGGAEVGSYDVVLTLKEPANYEWASVTDAVINGATITLKFKVEQLPLPYAQPTTYSPSQTLNNIALEQAPGYDWHWVDTTIVPQVGNTGYQVVLTDVDDNKYNLTGLDGYNSETHSITRTIPLEVDKAYLVAPTISSKTYNGETQAADVADTDLYTVTTNAGGTDVGSYDVVLTLKDPANYEWLGGEGATKTLTFQITKGAALEVVAPTVEPVKYDAGKTLKDVALPDGWAWVAPSTELAVGSQSHDAALTVDDANRDYTGVEGYDAETHKVTRAVPLTVSKGDFTPAISLDGWTYGEKPNEPTVTGNTSDGETVIAYAPKDDLSSYTAEPPTDAGDYTVGVYVYATDNYNEAWALADFTIAKAPIASVEVTGIDEPAADGALDTTATTSTAHMTLGDVAWVPADATATYATAYTATVRATADANHAFADNVAATVNGKPATATRNADGTLDISYTFDKTGLAPITITGTDKEVDYTTGAIDIAALGMFVIPDGAGEASYKVTPVTGEGTFANGKLTVTKAGTFTVEVSTLATDTHEAADATATLTVNKKSPTPDPVDPDAPTYKNVEGGGATWAEGTTTGLKFTFKRSADDKKTFDHFTGIQVDGVDVPKGSYDAVPGSVVVTLRPAFLEGLSAGEHTLTVLFDDADPAEATFTVADAATSKGDGKNDGAGTGTNNGAGTGTNNGTGTGTNNGAGTGTNNGAGTGANANAAAIPSASRATPTAASSGTALPRTADLTHPAVPAALALAAAAGIAAGLLARRKVR